MSNSKVIIELDREVAEFLDRTGEDAQVLLLGVLNMAGSNRGFAEKTTMAIENWKKVRLAIAATGVKRED